MSVSVSGSTSHKARETMTVQFLGHTFLSVFDHRRCTKKHEKPRQLHFLAAFRVLFLDDDVPKGTYKFF